MEIVPGKLGTTIALWQEGRHMWGRQPARFPTGILEGCFMLETLKDQARSSLPVTDLPREVGIPRCRSNAVKSSPGAQDFCLWPQPCVCL